jgi:D-cysteine desulfhydrase
MPEPERIFIPFATGGSVAGLLIGLALLQSSTQIVAVQTVDGVIANPRRLGRLIKSTLALIGTDRGFYGACMERLQTIDRRFLGKGYRDVPASVSAAVELASLNALELEPVFSGKALASLLDTRKQDDCIELLFWNTHDQQSNSVVAQ